MTPVVLFDPEAPAAPVEKPKVKVRPAAVPAAAPVVEVASSEVGLKLGTNISPVARVAGTQEDTNMSAINAKNLSVTVEGNKVVLAIADPAYRGEVTSSQKSRKVAWAGGILNIGGGLRMNVSITKDGVTG